MTGPAFLFILQGMKITTARVIVSDIVSLDLQRPQDIELAAHRVMTRTRHYLAWEDVLLIAVAAYWVGFFIGKL